MTDLRPLLAECAAQVKAAPIFVRPYLGPLLALLSALVDRLETIDRDR